MQNELRRTFASLAVPNYRLYFIGQGISLCGTWMQMIGLSWLVLKLTHSGTQLGLITAAQFLPILFFGMIGGVVADRFNKRRILYFTQFLLGSLALLLGVLVLTNAIHVWMVYVIAVAIGLVMVIDTPARQSFVFEMVGSSHIKNAVSLNSTIVNGARIVGPSIAAALIATLGIGMCFVFNAATFVAVLIALFLMNGSQLYASEPSKREPGQIQEGLRYAWHTPELRATLIMMLVIGTFTYEFPVVLPLFAARTLHGDAATYSLLTASMGVGAIAGGLYTASRGKPTQKLLTLSALVFGASILLVAAMPGLISSCITLVAVGALSVLFISLGNTTLQLTSAPTMRGRVMALWSIAFQGTTPIGGPIIGIISDHSNPRIGLAVGGLAAIVASGIGVLAIKSPGKLYGGKDTGNSVENLV